MIDEELICRDYENAAHPAAQVRIICELHALDVNTVKEILRKHGKDVPEAIPDMVGAKADAHSTHSGWTEEKARTLRALAEQGLCAKEIAERMGYTGDTIRKRALAAGIKDGEQFVIVENGMEHARGKNPIVVWSVYCGMLEQRGRRALGNWCGRHGRNRHTGEAEHEEG